MAPIHGLTAKNSSPPEGVSTKNSSSSCGGGGVVGRSVVSKAQCYYITTGIVFVCCIGALIFVISNSIHQ